MAADDCDLTALVGLEGQELAAALARALPEAVRSDAACGSWAEGWRGGRAAALDRLAGIDPAAYAASRNHVGGAVSRLSPWIRHGVLGLAEVRDAAVGRVPRPADAEKFVSELWWRAYWRLVQAAVGDAIDRDIEPPLTVPLAEAAAALPDDVRGAATGMPCIDDFIRRLHATGWLHNHERMWLASWLVHVRGVPWRIGAEWFLEHLIDGDPASNHLSWQWVAGTFSAQPYVVTRGNLETFTAAAHCSGCDLRGRCSIEGDHTVVADRHLRPSGAVRSRLRIPPAAAWRLAADPPRRPLVWLTLDSASAVGPAVVAHPEAPAVFVVDRGWLKRERPTLKRLVFLFECLADVPHLEVHVGDPGRILPACAARHAADGVVVAETPCPWVRAAAAGIHRDLPVSVREWPALAGVERVSDLGRFSRSWQVVRDEALRPSAPSAAR